MRDFPLPFTVLALTPATWAFFTLEAFIRNGSHNLLLSSVIAMVITLALIFVDVVIALRECDRGSKARRHRERLKAASRRRRSYRHHLNQKD